MYIKKLEYGNGMIFIYDQPKILSFWMKKTLIPLGIAYIDESSSIIEIYEMTVADSSSDENKLPVYTSTYPAKFAVEVPSGWFELYGIQKGDKIELPEILF